MSESKQINREFFEAIAKFKRRPHKNIKIQNLYAGEYMALRTIEKLKMINEDSIGVKTSDIGNCLCMKKPATSKMLNNLEDKGYIKRLSDKKDRRVTYVDLTQEGENLLKEQHQQMIDFTNRVVDEMGEEDTKTLTDLLNKLFDIIDHLSEN
ncbi:MarR family winged helix-turn-helix transcriptional regulator [Intestinibacter sp.]